MEFRWLTTDEKRTRTLETDSLPEVLALAQKLQAEGGGFVSEDEVIEMGRELGVRPEYVREALRLRRRAAQPVPAVRTAPDLSPVDDNPVARAVQASLFGLGLGTLPLALMALGRSHAELLAVLIMIAPVTAGWMARHPRLAAVAGTLAVPAMVLASALFLGSMRSPGMEPDAFFFSLLSFCPLGAAAGRGAAKARRWLERLAERERPAVLGH